MGEYFEMVNEVAREHRKGLLKSSGVETAEKNIEEFTRSWVEKRSAISLFRTLIFPQSRGRSCL